MAEVGIASGVGANSSAAIKNPLQMALERVTDIGSPYGIRTRVTGVRGRELTLCYNDLAILHP